MATKTSYNQRFHKKMAYSTKRAYSIQTTSFQHDKIWIIFNISYTIFICYTNPQIIILKIPDKKVIMATVTGNATKFFLTLWPKNMTNIEICPRKNVQLKPFRLIWVFLWLHLLLALFRWPHLLHLKFK